MGISSYFWDSFTNQVLRQIRFYRETWKMVHQVRLAAS